MTTKMETRSGKLVDLASPDPKSITIDDVAWHLSRQPRFCGATTSDVVYNVAQHSVIVMNRVKSENPDATPELLLRALLHDSHEAYMGDVISPMKNLLDLSAPLRRLQSRLHMAVIRSMQKTIGKEIGFDIDPEIHRADMWAQSYEAYHLLLSRGRWWPFEKAELLEQEMYRNFIVWEPVHAYNSFRNHFEDLTDALD